jgi:hypothetical protein
MQTTPEVARLQGGPRALVSLLGAGPDYRRATPSVWRGKGKGKRRRENSRRPQRCLRCRISPPPPNGPLGRNQGASDERSCCTAYGRCRWGWIVQTRQIDGSDRQLIAFLEMTARRRDPRRPFENRPDGTGAEPATGRYIWHGRSRDPASAIYPPSCL